MQLLSGLRRLLVQHRCVASPTHKQLASIAFQNTHHLLRSRERRMTTKADKIEWLVILPDRPGKLRRRMLVRTQHIDDLQKGHREGFWKMGGAFLEDIPKEGEDMKIEGSAMIALAHSREEVLERLKRDIYAEQDVWDFEKVKIYPFKCACRTAL